MRSAILLSAIYLGEHLRSEFAMQTTELTIKSVAICFVAFAVMDFIDFVRGE